MKKQLIIISVLVIIAGVFVSCSANISDENISTTAVTDSRGTTHYFEPVTDDKGNVSTTEKKQGVFAEIETQSDGKAVTKKNGTYVTNEYTTLLPIGSVTDKSSTTTQKSTSDTTKDIDNADNEVEFEPDETTEQKPTTTATTEKETTTTTTTAATQATTQKETQPATDKEGWITKWY